MKLLYFLITMGSYKDFLKYHDIIPDIYNIRGSKNIEHVIPKNFKKHTFGCYTNDLHFIYNANKDINNWRSSFKFDKIDEEESENPKISLFNKNKDIKKDTLLNTFLPPKYARGIIARICVYFIYKYPMYKRYFTEIINPQTLVEWNYEYPVTLDEYHRNVMVSVLEDQKDRNIFVDNENLVYSFIKENYNVDIEPYLGKSKSILQELSLYWE